MTRIQPTEVGIIVISVKAFRFSAIFGEEVQFDIKALLSGKPVRGLIGLDISATAIKLVELGQDKNGYRIERYAIETLPRDAVSEGNIVQPEQVATTLQRVWKRMGTSTRNVALALPASAVITKQISVFAAGLREDELEAEVASEASQYIPFALEEVNLDFQVLGLSSQSPDEYAMLVAAAKKERVEDRVAVAELAGL